MALLNFTSGIRLTKSINRSRGEWAQQQYVLLSTYKGGDADVWVGPIFVHYLMGKESNTIASIQNLFKIVPMQVAQHLKTHCMIMWMKVGTNLS